MHDKDSGSEHSRDEGEIHQTLAELAQDPSFRGAVIAGIVPDQSPRVAQEAGRYAQLHGVSLLVVHVDVTRFVTYEDPDGYVHSAPIDINIAAGESDFALIAESAQEVLGATSLNWRAIQLVGDPAMALKHLADKLDATLLVVGTRRRGLGESIREFFTGSVAARLSHRQQRPILVVPTGEPIADDEEIWPS